MYLLGYIGTYQNLHHKYNLDVPSIITLSFNNTGTPRGSRDYLDQKMASNDKPVYGINTGFGSLCNVKISNENLSKLQENIVKSADANTAMEKLKELVEMKTSGLLTDEGFEAMKKKIIEQ